MQQSVLGVSSIISTSCGRKAIIMSAFAINMESPPLSLDFLTDIETEKKQEASWGLFRNLPSKMNPLRICGH
jgi:hypothetical protein